MSMPSDESLIVEEEHPQPMAEPSLLGPVSRQTSRGFWAEAWVRFRCRPASMAALLFIMFLSLVAIFSPAIVGTKPIICKFNGKIYVPCLAYFWPEREEVIIASVRSEHKFRRFRGFHPIKMKEQDPESWAIWPLVYQDPQDRVREDQWPGQPENPAADQGEPNRYNLMGTTQKGIDVFAQLVHGTRTALLIGFVATGISAAIGIVLGGLAGYFRGWVDVCVSRIIEIVMCVPAIVLILALISILPKTTVWHLMVVIGITGWTGIARLTRAEFLKLRETEFVSGARALGAGNLRIMFRHILPNSLAPILVPISFGIASAILIESSLSFLGFGAANSSSWGSLVANGRSNRDMWWLTVFPGIAIFLTVLAYNLIGEGIREATDPRLRQAKH